MSNAEKFARVHARIEKGENVKSACKAERIAVGTYYNEKRRKKALSGFVPAPVAQRYNPEPIKNLRVLFQLALKELDRLV